ncbi:MAG: hypothetical protein P4L99_17210 [Chthoniobacter sp.]|nr:hypothetical protein [Chthoniobacter sp.]
MSIELVTETFLAATEAIEAIYFQVPVAGKENPVYRERVYCYELYHQMRSRWPDIPQRITGEIDKGGHPWIYGDDLDRSKPDFTIHVPGKMGPNLLVMEVKCPDPNDDQIVTDLQKLTAFGRLADYPFAYYLLYGIDAAGAKEFASLCRGLEAKNERIELRRINFFYQSAPRTRALVFDWPAA